MGSVWSVCVLGGAEKDLGRMSASWVVGTTDSFFQSRGKIGTSPPFVFRCFDSNDDFLGFEEKT
jgi:hypothetical protein